MPQKKDSKVEFYFSTRDLLIMTVLAALGGVASSYINTIGDAVQAVLGFAGGSQWAAGLHVIWIVLSVGILQKPGTGTFTGILKGFVELLSGNSHGIIILLIDIVAGLLVDFGFLFFSNKRHLVPFLVAGGLATASNVLVFQIFATLPQNILGVTAITLLFIVAMVSGLVFAGLIPYGLVNSLAKGGIVKEEYLPPDRRRIIWYVLVGVSVLAAIFAVFLRVMLTGPQAVEISGAVSNPITFPNKELNLKQTTKKMDYRGVLTEYSGFQLAEVLDYVKPKPEADTVLLQASDGYAFLLSFNEIKSNPNIIIVQNGGGKNASFDMVGPESSKAWVRNLEKIIVIDATGLEIQDAKGETHTFNPDLWTNDMDSTLVSLAEGSAKLQGVPLWKIIENYRGDDTPGTIHFRTNGQVLDLTWADLNQNDEIRLFSLIRGDQIYYLLAKMSGELIIENLTSIEID